MQSPSTEAQSTQAKKELGYVDVKPIISRLGDLASESLVLIGGQATNFWVDFYLRQGRLPELEEQAPFTSKDIDFCGSREAVKQCALRLNGTFRLPEMDDHTPNTGVVAYFDDSGVERFIDILEKPYGLQASKVYATAVPVDILNDDGTPSGLTFAVMHPVWCMFSRAYNTAELPLYNSPHALRQLAASVHCAREFLRDLLADDRRRAVLKLNERILSFCGRRVGLKIFSMYKIDLFGAVLVDPNLPEDFRTKRYPRMERWLEERRRREASRVLRHTRARS